MSGRLTEAQRRHLREMVNERGETRFWRPTGAGEQRCADTLRRRGLLEGSHLTYADAYFLSPEGLRIARELVASGPSS